MIRLLQDGTLEFENVTDMLQYLSLVGSSPRPIHVGPTTLMIDRTKPTSPPSTPAAAKKSSKTSSKKAGTASKPAKASNPAKTSKPAKASKPAKTSKAPPAHANGRDTSKTTQPSRARGWNETKLAAMWSLATAKLQTLIEVASTMPDGTSSQDLAKKCEYSITSLGTMVNRIALITTEIDPALRSPVRLEGIPGRRTLIVDPTFRSIVQGRARGRQRRSPRRAAGGEATATESEGEGAPAPGVLPPDPPAGVEDVQLPSELPEQEPIVESQPDPVAVVDLGAFPATALGAMDVPADEVEVAVPLQAEGELPLGLRLLPQPERELRVAEVLPEVVLEGNVERNRILLAIRSSDRGLSLRELCSGLRMASATVTREISVLLSRRQIKQDRGRFQIRA